MESVSIGISLKRLKELHRELGDQIADAESRVAAGSSGDGAVEIRIEAGANTTIQEPVDLIISNDDMERDEIRESVLVDVS